MSDLWLDLKYAARMLGKTPLLTFVAASSLALGIGANTTVFTLVKAVFLEPVPVEDASSLVSIFRSVDERVAGAGGGIFQSSFANFEDVERRSRSFDSLAADTFGSFSVSGGGEPAQVFGAYVTVDYFRTLGLSPSHGRFFGPDDEDALVVVLSHGIWQTRFGGDVAIVGRDIQVNGRPFTVVGIAPPNFKGLFTLANQELWVPVRLYPRLNSGFIAQALTHRGLRLFGIVGRLKADADVGEAEAEVQTIARALEVEHPEWNRDRSFVLMPLVEATLDPNQRGTYLRAGIILTAAVSLVLAIACANVASLLLSRSRARRRELAMRLSLGATRARLARQLLTEAILLSALGGGLGLLIAAWTRPLLWRIRPPFLPEGSLDLSLDPAVLGFTTLVALGSGVLFGIAPAWSSARVSLLSATKDPQQEARDDRRSPLRHTIVVAQSAFALVSLAVAGIFLQSLSNASGIDPGFEHERLAIASIDLEAQNYAPPEARAQFERIVTELSELPSVVNVALGSSAPLSFPRGYRVIPQGAEGRAGEDGVYVGNNSVSPTYFDVMGLSAREGRVLDARDGMDARQVVVVNETFATTFWPGQSAVGKRVVWPAAEGPWDVVGVVPDIKVTTLGEPPTPFFYRPLEQEHTSAVTLHVLSDRAPTQALFAALERLRQMDPNLPVVNAMSLEEALRRSLWAARLGAALLSVFGLLALALSSVGIYGVLAYGTETRRREIGIRMALGAERPAIVRQVLWEGLLPVAAGAIVGGIIAVVAIRAASDLLYGMAGSGAAVLVGASATLGVVALAACLVPALRTTRIDPVRTLSAD